MALVDWVVDLLVGRDQTGCCPWRLDNRPLLRLAAGRLVVLVSGFVVAAYAVTGLECQDWDVEANRRRARFLVKPDKDVASPFINRRWSLPPGWAVSVIGAHR